MKFEVNKFLALTAALATAAAAAAGCSATDKKAVDDVGGAGNTAGASGAPDEGKAGASEGGETSAGGQAGEGGAGGSLTEGGAGGSFAEGGAAGGSNFECIGELVGAGGAADEGAPGPCEFWYGLSAPDCGGELNPPGDLCYDLNAYTRPAVVAAFNDCAKALSNNSQCAEQTVYGCATQLVGMGCKQDTTADACALVATLCTDTALSNCPGVMNLANADAVGAIEDCMDPTGESFDETFDGTCDQRLLRCARVSPPPAQLPPEL